MKKFIYFILAGAALMLSNGCQRQGAIYDIPEGNACVSFPSNKAKFEMLASDGNKVTVELWRGNTKGAASVAVDIEDHTNGVFAPSKESFEFADGQAVATIDFTYPDINAFGGEIYEVVLKVSDPDQVSPSGYGKLTVSAQRKLTPKYVATGIFHSLWFGGEEWEQPICTTEEAPNVYILPDCFEEGYDWMFSIIDGEPVFSGPFDTGAQYGDYGNVFIEPDYCVVEDGVLYVVVKRYYVKAGTIASGYEALILPEGFSF